MQTAPLQRSQAQTHVRVNSFIRSVYNWMGGGLAITGFLAYMIAQRVVLYIRFTAFQGFFLF
jgi:FtsH-binding integral membrane protein